MKRLGRATYEELAYEYCTKCIYFSHGKCFAYNVSGIRWVDVYKTFGLKDKGECEYSIDRNKLDRFITMSLALARDAKVHNDKVLAETAMAYLAKCKIYTYNADARRVEQEIYDLRTLFNIDVSEYIEKDKTYHTANEAEKNLPWRNPEDRAQASALS